MKTTALLLNGKPVTGPACKELRKSLGKNQTDFWTPLGVTQSGSSRYEAGRSIPKPVQILLVIAYGTLEESSDMVASLWGRKEGAK